MYQDLKALFKSGLSSPISITWEITYGCNLSCTHCLSDSGSRAPGELGLDEAYELLDSLAAMKVFYINIGGGEPMLRRDFFQILDRAQNLGIGIKFSTNGYFLDDAAARKLSRYDNVDVQVSIDGHDQASNDIVRGAGSYNRALIALDNLRRSNFSSTKISVVINKHNIEHVDDLYTLAAQFGASLRITRLRPSGRGANSYQELSPSAQQYEVLHEWLLNHKDVLTGDSFFHLAPLGGSLEGLNMCGAGKVVCLVDPVGDVYACPFTIHPAFKAGNVREMSFREVWEKSPLFEQFRETDGPKSCQSCSVFSSCQGGCMAAKFHTGASLDDPDPDCVRGNGKVVGTVVSLRPKPLKRNVLI